jgi:hypothetical protein
MKYRSLTLVLAYCFAALGTAHTESGFLGNLDCDGARDVYPLPVGNGGENNAIFDEMRDGECTNERAIAALDDPHINVFRKL